jgi:hypothetical protein
MVIGGEGLESFPPSEYCFAGVRNCGKQASRIERAFD